MSARYQRKMGAAVVDPASGFAVDQRTTQLQSSSRENGMINDLWYKNAIIYCVSVGSYMDANGDGIGDFPGLMRRLDYLHGLGVTAIWLMPFQHSPMRDDGYDISDYYSVDPRYGTLGDFVEFTHGCKQRGIRVLIDLVVNHTSDQHPWFQAARRDPQSPYRDWYVWAKRKPAHGDSGIVFPESRSRPGPTTASPRRGTFTASTISNLISIPPTRMCRPRS